MMMMIMVMVMNAIRGTLEKKCLDEGIETFFSVKICPWHQKWSFFGSSSLCWAEMTTTRRERSLPETRVVVQVILHWDLYSVQNAEKKFVKSYLVQIELPIHTYFTIFFCLGLYLKKCKEIFLFVCDVEKLVLPKTRTQISYFRGTGHSKKINFENFFFLIFLQWSQKILHF